MVIPCIPLSIFLLYPLLHTITSAQIPLGSILQPSNNNNSNNYWTSPNNTFSLGFIPITSSSFSLAISFSNITVWKAGGDSAIVDSAARFQLLHDGNLLLINGSGTIIWQSMTTNRSVTTATLDDLGNFSLKNGSITIWSTFDNPTDTILPYQNFTINKTLRNGNYSFVLLSSGSLNLRWNEDTIYWNKGLNSSLIMKNNVSSLSLSIQQTGILQLYDPTFSSPVVIAYTSDYGEASDLRFLKLDSDGNLRIYNYIKGGGTYVERWAAVLDQCEVYGYCGNMGLCSYIDSMPVCDCISEEFEFLDPNERRKGCKRKMELKDCPNNATMLKLDHTLLLTYPPELMNQAFFVGISGCRLNCLMNPGCVASTVLSEGEGLCYLKVRNFLSGYQSAAIPSTSFVKVCGPIFRVGR